MFKRILVPLDGSSLAECVLPHVIAFARAFDADVTLLQVLEQPHSPAIAQTIDPVEWEFFRAEADSYLIEMTVRLKGFGLKVTKTLREGQAAEHIIDFAHQNDIDLIILSSHGQSGLSNWNVSGVFQKIILRAFISLLIVRAYRPVNHDLANQGYRQLMVPLDGSQRAEVVLPVTKVISHYYRSKLLLAHLTRKPAIHSRLPLTPAETELVSQITDHNRKWTAKYLEELCSHSMPGVDSHIHIVEGGYTELHDLVEVEHVDLVLLSAHGQSGNPRWPYGSVTLSFIVYGMTPLLIVQDLDRAEVQRTSAEMIAREKKGH
ncbi:MAG: universal stress protein [Anaerolineales bacterium]|nr:universal stress protein [Anaerolineales bacterium]